MPSILLLPGPSLQDALASLAEGRGLRKIGEGGDGAAIGSKQRQRAEGELVYKPPANSCVPSSRALDFLVVKIEIAESLILSWLRHVQGCFVTQMNWKPSPNWSISREQALREQFEHIRAFAGERIGVPIFKKCGFAQFVRQAEIDVLGLRLSQDSSTSHAIAVDSAFHEGGLNYGSADETVGRVLKKMVRAALAVSGYLNVRGATLVFATPKVAEPIREPIERRLADLEAAFATDASVRPHLRLRLIANHDFSTEILQPVLEAADTVADTSELFMRAQQLMGLCEKPARVGTTHQGEGVGVHVRATMANLAASGRLTPEIVTELSCDRYSKHRFNLSHPFLKRVNPALDLLKQRQDHHGHARYWKPLLNIGGREFLMCQEWKEDQRTAFDRWVRDLG